jgi:hypothetical protein
MTHRLNVVAVGIENEGGVIVGVIVGPQAGSAIVSSASMKCCNVEGIDTGSVDCDDGDVQRPFEPAFAADPEVRLAGLAEPCRGSPAFRVHAIDLHHKSITERRKRLRVESLGTRVVRNRKADVIDHERDSWFPKENSPSFV